MKVKNVIAQSADARRFSNWLEAQNNIGFKTSITPPEFVEIIMDYPIEDIIEKNLYLFQRKLQSGRLIKIGQKVIEFGYLVIPIMLDELGKMVDGQHRVTVLHLMGFKTIPAVIYKFQNQKDKPYVFSKISMPEGGGPALLDRINTRKIAGYPYETMIHKLIMLDTHSMFYDRVGYKGASNLNQKISLPNFIKMFNWIGLGVRRKWDANYDPFLQDTVQQMNRESYETVRDRLNSFAVWLFGWAGDTREGGNKDLYKEKVITGFMDVYLMMIDQAENAGDLVRMKRESSRRFKGFKVVNLMHLDHEGIPGAIIQKYNHGRRDENRMMHRDLGIRIGKVWSVDVK
ncbi:hypothetical protein KAR91_80335 [Candidatus Pacearchaeota archaeon]|nr:hypothetical protein [Candidatus Pacearchaeota archaeon]